MSLIICYLQKFSSNSSAMVWPLTLYRPMTHIRVINQFFAKRPMTHTHVMGTSEVSFVRSGLSATIYALNHIHCTHQKLNEQYWPANKQCTSRKLNVTRRKSLSQSTGPTLSRPISGSTQAMKMKQKAA